MQLLSPRPIIYLALAFVVIAGISRVVYKNNSIQVVSAVSQSETTQNIEVDSVIPAIEIAPVAQITTKTISHIPTPEPLKGLYITSWVASTTDMRNHVLSIVDKTEINSVVFDIKDYTGKISYPVLDPELISINSSDRRIKDLRDFTNLLHSKGIYVIGRIAAFQDPYFVKLHPEYAVKTNTDKTKVWTDRKGISWLDAGERPVWDYLVSIAKDAHAQGVDEVQFDYVRFPSDGNLSDIYYPSSDGKPKFEVINSFFDYVHTALLDEGMPTSADLFGLTTTATDDMGIGQLLEGALKNFDYVSPMVYPSHFAPGFENFKDPQSHPYEVIKISMSKAVARANAIGVSPTKLRPWLQEFGLHGKVYGSTEIRDQIKGVYDSGLTSWLIWDPSNKYSAGGLESAIEDDNLVN